MARPPAPSSSTFSVIGADVTIKGDVSASTELHVDGRIEGDIACDSLVQGETSVIEGAISAETARLAGRISGSITARHLVVLKSARVEGDVNYDALTIEQGAQVEGRFAHRAPNQRGADKPAAPVAASDDGEPKLTLAT
ncbi:bactofilin family protein [Pelagerythrobacter aerophilus]